MTAGLSVLSSAAAEAALSLDEVQSGMQVIRGGREVDSGTDFLKIEKDIVKYYTYKLRKGGIPDRSGALTYYKDNLAQKALQSIYLPLTKAATRPDLKWQAFIADSKSVNAFTCGGGLTVVHSDLIKFCKSEAELASVLAHEIGHIEHRHAIRRLMSNEILKQFGMSSDQAILDEVYALKAKGKDIRSSVMMKVSLEIFEKNFGRMWEHQADAFILKAFEETGYDVGEASQFFRTLLKLFGKSPQWTCMFSSHPDVVERINRVEAIARTMSPIRNPKKDSDAFRYLKKNIGHRDI